MSIIYNDYVKKPNIEIEYTQEEIKELVQCMDDIFFFLKYVKVVHPDKGRVPFVPYPFQEDIIELINNNRFTVIMCARQQGKCVCKDISIKIRNKHTKEIKEIPIGDFYEMIKNKK